MMTNDANKVLYVLYREYADKVQHGFSRSSLKDFGSASSILEDFFPEMCLEDLNDVLSELAHNGFVNNSYASNSIYLCILSDKAISFYEALPKNALLNFASFLFEFVKLLASH